MFKPVGARVALACMKGWTEDTQVRGLADGAKHIRPRMADAFHACPFHFILDRPHAKEHLAAAGAELEKLGGQPKEHWAADALDRMEDGHVLEVVAELRAAAIRAANDTLRREADYFERNRDAVAYRYYREQGWGTAESEVESGHRSVIQVRLKLPGTRVASRQCPQHPRPSYDQSLLGGGPSTGSSNESNGEIAPMSFDQYSHAKGSPRPPDRCSAQCPSRPTPCFRTGNLCPKFRLQAGLRSAKASCVPLAPHIRCG